MNLTFITLLTSLAGAVGGTIYKHLFAASKEISHHGSLARMSEAARVEPIVLVDATAADHSELTSSVLEASLNVFTAFYLQAVALSNVTVGGVQIINRLSAFNPNRKPDFDGVVNSTIGNKLSLAMESNEDADIHLTRDIFQAPQNLYEESLPSVEAYTTHMPKSGEVIKDLPALAVGKIFDVELRDGKETYTVPIMVRFSAAKIQSAKLAEALIARFGQEENALDRKMGWKSGRLSFIRDLLFCSDKVREHRKRLMYDNDGLYSKLNPNKLNNQLATLASGEPSLAKASNVLVLDAETAKSIQNTLGGSFDKLAFRQRMLENSAIMILAIIDREWDHVTFYYDGIEHSNVVRASDLSKANKKNGPDVNDVLRALVAGNAPLR